MDIVKKIDKIRKEKGWTVNKLAYEAALTQSTVANMFSSGAEPKISTLKAICDAYNITLSEFFYENTATEINPKTLDMIFSFNKLSDEEQRTIYDLIKIMEKNKKND